MGSLGLAAPCAVILACPQPPSLRLCCSALSAAVLSGSLVLVQLLVSHGACGPRNGGQFIGRDHAALRAVALAAQRGRVDLLQTLYPPLAKALQGECGLC